MYTDKKTGELVRFNDDWEAKGLEKHFGIFGYGQVDFTNSFRKPTVFKYLSFMLPIPGKKEIGVDIGAVRGYKGHKQGIYVGEWMLGICPKMRWEDDRYENRFVTLRQFGSASIRTYGVTRKGKTYEKVYRQAKKYLSRKGYVR